jgi:hypothetical protein
MDTMHINSIAIFCEVITFVDQFMALCFTAQCNRCTDGCEIYTNFANESICLLADNVWNEVQSNLGS